MKIIEQTASRLVFKHHYPLPLLCFIALWASLFSGMPLIMMGLLAADAGVISLSCRRLEPTQVECIASRSRFFGIVAGQPTQTRQVTVAQVDTEIHSSDEGGDYEVYRVQLVSPQGSFGVTPFDSNLLLAQDSVIQINQFLRSSQAQIRLIQDQRWDVNKTIAPLLFLSIFVLVGIWVLYGMLRVQTLVLDKALNRITFKVQTLLGAQVQTYPLGVLTDLELKEHTDSYGNKYYEPILLPDTIKHLTLVHTYNRQEALHIQAQVRDFLKPHSTP